jgi:hypothetical protein
MPVAIAAWTGYVSGTSAIRAASASRTPGSTASFRTTPVSTRELTGGGNLAAPSSASRASVTPTAKNPIGRMAKTRMRDASTSTSGASASGASSPATVAHNGGLREMNAQRRSRGRDASVPNAAPIEKPTVTSSVEEISTS